jgi:hypothetical protein
MRLFHAFISSATQTKTTLTGMSGHDGRIIETTARMSARTIKSA